MSPGRKPLNCSFNPTLSPIQARALRGKPDNDNEPAGSTDAMLHAALRHFAVHGLGAATVAKRKAEEAFFAGDRENYTWWLGVCRTLDRRIARTLRIEAEREADEAL
jgi:hypothetical protein